jgi:hypothetical protein
MIEAICPRCNLNYKQELTERYLKVEEQEKMIKIIKEHEC